MLRPEEVIPRICLILFLSNVTRNPLLCIMSPFRQWEQENTFLQRSSLMCIVFKSLTRLKRKSFVQSVCFEHFY